MAGVPVGVMTHHYLTAELAPDLLMIPYADRLVFFVPGRPQPAGSKRAFPIRRAGQLTGRVAVTDDNPRTKSWQAEIASAAAAEMLAKLKRELPNRSPQYQEVFRRVEEMGTGPYPVPLTGPLGMSIVFVLNRPKGHYRTGRFADMLRDSAPAWPSVKPDTTKLVRAVEDALTGVVWRDDAQVVEQYAAKRYADGEPQGVSVTVWPL